MFPLLAIVVCPDDNVRRFSIFHPCNQTQDDVVIRPIVHGRDDTTRESTTHYALSHLPRTRSARTMTHAGDHKETVKVVQIIRPC